MIPTLLQPVDEPDPGPKLLDKETYFRSQLANQLVRKFKTLMIYLARNPKRKPNRNSWL